MKLEHGLILLSIPYILWTIAFIVFIMKHKEYRYHQPYVNVLYFYVATSLIAIVVGWIVVLGSAWVAAEALLEEYTGE